jgi:hypothetical protein
MVWLRTPTNFLCPGTIGWLFDDNFCDFSRHHLSFNIGVGFAGGSFMKRVMRTACLDRFCGGAGPALPGYVSLSATSNHSGRGIEHHNVPARFLTPATPTAKGQFVLVLQGELRGRFCQVFRWIRKERKVVVPSVVAEDSEDCYITLSADEVCLATPSNY